MLVIIGTENFFQALKKKMVMEQVAQLTALQINYLYLTIRIQVQSQA